MVLEVANLNIRAESREMFEVLSQKPREFWRARGDTFRINCSVPSIIPTAMCCWYSGRPWRIMWWDFEGRRNIADWREALHHFLSVAPTVEHYQLI